MVFHKKGVSVVVGSLILITLVLVASLMVWTFVNQIIKDRTEKASSCFGIADKITINNKNTCYNSETKEFYFSINRGDVEVDELLISITGQGTSKSFSIDDASFFSDVKGYDEEYNEIVVLPEKEAGLTYILNVNSQSFETPESIKIAPKINEQQCDVCDELLEIPLCSS